MNQGISKLRYELYLGGGNSNICLFSTRYLGEMIQFDEHIFSTGLKPPTSLCLMV